VPALELRQYEPADADAVWDHHEPDDAGVIRRMRVDPDHQRREFGSTLPAALEACAPELGFDRFVLDTTPRQAAAMVRYEECLFE
jgi:GNAT superfamily N-acetyltransferase